jgi:hypothetical protein
VQDDRNAGHAWLWSSAPQPGKAEKDAARKAGLLTGGAFSGVTASGITGGGDSTAGTTLGFSGDMDEQAANPDKVNTSRLLRTNDIRMRAMWLLFVEAGMALFLLIFIVWWTMFAGKKPTHPPKQKPLPPKDDAPDRTHQ